ncbi:hypothetical protein P4112_00530 [Pseudomonas aeruginosa]|nr:hypothetical protein [Pseudomonas aeruginosa]
MPAFTVMSCDNLPHNGEVARKALLAFAERLDPGLARWIATHVSFPNAMVDRITPMTSPAHRRQLAQRHDVKTPGRWSANPSCNGCWKIVSSAGRPAWEKVGVQFTDDVTPYEEMKIGLLNGSHLALTYLGFLRGYRFVHETLGDPLLRRYVRAFMDRDVAPLLAPVPGSTWNATRTAWSSASPTAPSPTNWNGSARTARRSFPSSSSPPPIG